jgi:lysophospholipase L1-like esterase
VKSVLCYGDSNTWGTATMPRPDGRYAPGERWPGVLGTDLGSDWLVIEEGLPGRTTVSDDPIEGAEKNGLTYLLPCLNSHKPLDVIVVMLGTNDLKARFGKSAWEIAAGVGRLIDVIRAAPAIGRGGRDPAVVLVCPPPMLDRLPGHEEMFAGGASKSREMAVHYRRLAEMRSTAFLDAGSVVRSSVVDGFHLDPEAHLALGHAIASIVRTV